MTTTKRPARLTGPQLDALTDAELHDHLNAYVAIATTASAMTYAKGVARKLARRTGSDATALVKAAMDAAEAAERAWYEGR
jgi:hypothetical protein